MSSKRTRRKKDRERDKDKERDRRRGSGSSRDQDSESESGTRFKVPLFANKGFVSYFDEGVLTDLEISINAQSTFQVHRLLVAHASAYFNRMLLSHHKAARTSSDEDLGGSADSSGGSPEKHLEVNGECGSTSKSVSARLVEREKGKPCIELTFLDQDEVDVFPRVVRFIYSGRIELNSDNAVPVLSVADRFEMATLKRLAVDFIVITAANIERDNALQLLRRATRFKVEQIVSSCVAVIGRNLCFMHNASFSFMLPEIFARVLQCEQLAVDTEYNLYRMITEYIDARDDVTPQQVEQMYSCVRWRWMSLVELREAKENEQVPRDMLIDAMLVMLEAQDGSENRRITSTIPAFMPRLRLGIEFKYHEKYDEMGLLESKGVINWVATGGGRVEWSNPHESGLVRVVASSIEKGHPKQLVERTPSELWTKDVPASWLCIDLGEGRRVVPNYYTLRHGGNYRADSMRTWDFQGSVDSTNWVVLRRHTNDTSLNQPFAVHSWCITCDGQGMDKGYRYFRLLQRGHNSSNHNFLVASGIEFYGTLHENY